MKKVYVKPDLLAVCLPEPIAEVMPMSEDDENGAKKNDIEFDFNDWDSEDDDSGLYESLWDD